MGEIVLGVVADDFTGASDAASFLVQQGVKTLLFNGTPQEPLPISNEKIAVVIALKTRTEEKNKAIVESLSAFSWLKDNGAKQFYSKYCSTFDSNETGNIGPVIDNFLEYQNIKYTIIAPSLPINGRIVKNGHLFVQGVPLNKTHMKDHPLTPMWDSDLEKLISPQGKYESLKITEDMLFASDEQIFSLVDEFGSDKDHFYVIPDYVNENHGARIVELFGDLPFLTGGSGLVGNLGRKYRKEGKAVSEVNYSSTEGKAIILSGSCSETTLQQVENFQINDGNSIKLDANKLIEGTQTKEQIWEEISSSKDDAALVYSSDTPENVKNAQSSGVEKISEILEQTTAYIAKRAKQHGYNRIIVAGGETSGAVTQALGYDAYVVGESIASGVPIMVPLNNKKLRLVLKSGDFGQEDFFMRAVNLTKGDSNDS
ncbi:3-oxo-tetronate kinase [Thalassobacillus sp. CUG 92003]|uniref:3-oxo-tetronate kinase n=1 Tax=Thalassobacillus sp. CUG 92003 TaxID=2736641 RepID=UPI0015E77AEF|nr:3-oxo-tetronate kinase [Thalassobacillus sp. CUG 92003]